MSRCAMVLFAGLVVPLHIFGSVTIGDRAPEIKLDALLPSGPPSTATLDALRGKAIVLEFWATWCGPCYFAIPHLNDLASRFEGRPIQFISVTDEERHVVEEFLKRRPIKGWVGLESGGLRKAYGISGIPVAVLIDSTGHVAGVAHPTMIQVNHLEDLLARRPVPLPPLDMAEASPGKTDRAPEASPIVDIQLRISTASEMSMSSNKGRSQINGVTPRWLVSWAYRFPAEQVTGDLDNHTKYDLILSLPTDGVNRTSTVEFLQAFVCSVFSLQVKRETRETQVLVLAAPAGKSAALRETATPGTPTWMSQNGEIHIVDHSVGVLASVIRGQLNQLVVDETGIGGKYDFDLRVDPTNPESVLDAVRSYGLAIETGIRPVEFLVVSKLH